MRRSIRLLIPAVTALIVLAVAMPALAAAPGDLDTSFSGDGVRTVDYSGLSDTFYGVAIDGNAPAACGTSQQRATVTMLKPKGGLDSSFSGDGELRLNVLGNDSSSFEACRFLPDGRIVAAGTAQADDGDDRLTVAVIRPGGRLDTTFSGDGVAAVSFPGLPNVYAYDLAVQPDGKIVAVGETYDNSVSPAAGWFAVARFRQNGSLDNTFGGDGRVKVDFHAGDEGVWKVILQHDGKIVLAGWVRKSNDTEWNTGVARLKPNGSLDGTFSGNGKAEYNLLQGADDYALGLDVTSEGTIVLGIYGYDGTYRARIAELQPGGNPEHSFGGGDGVLAGFASDLSVQDLSVIGGKILIGGSTNSGSNAMLMRLRGGGAPDGAFGTNGVADLGSVPGYLYDFARDAQGRIVAAGRASTDGLVLRVIN